MRRAVQGTTQGILSYFTRHRTMANLLLILLLAAGMYALPKMRAQFFPDSVIETIRVQVAWPGAGAEDVDRAIVQLLEPALLGIEGVESSDAVSREGVANIRLDFEPGWDMAKADDDVSNVVDGLTGLPADAETPHTTVFSFSERVTDVVITGPVGVDQLAGYADELVGRLFAEGVTRTSIRGVAAPETVVEVSTANLIAYDVTLREIADTIAAQVDANPAGDVAGAGARVRTGVEKRSVQQIEGITLRSYSDGRKLTIGDVADITVNGADRDRSYFVGTNPAVSIRVDRSAQGDAIDIQRRVQEVADAVEATLPAGSSIDLIRTRAEVITGRLRILIENGIMGLGLVLVLLFLFLNARTAFWVAAGIPIAMMAAVGLMYAGGLTFNLISLFALIITLGIVVDDAIVVGEHADARARLGEGPYEAAENAAIRMSKPVFTATITTIIAFFGLTAVGGRFGSIIADIPFTVVAVLAASLVECFLILPNHMAHALRHVHATPWYDWPSRQVNRGVDWFRKTVFRPLMAGVITARYVVLAGSVFLLAWQGAALVRGDVPWRFINFPERTSVSGNFAMAPGATREDSLEMMRELQRATDALAREYETRYGTNPVLYVVAEVGGNAGRGLSGTDAKDRDQLGAISIELIDRDSRPYSAFRFIGDLQDAVRRHPLAETVSFRGGRAGPASDALSVQFFGAEAEVLKVAAEDLKTALTRFPEVSALQDSLAYDKEELVLELTPQGEALGFTTDALGAVLRHRIGGIEAASYPVGPRSATVTVQVPATELTADFLERMQLRNPQGTYVQLADIVSVERRASFASVQRENGLRLVAVTGDIDADDPEQANLIERALENEILPQIAAARQVGWQLSGQSEDERAFQNDATFGLILSLIGIYLALAWVFASWTRPLVVMSVIPFGFVGVIYGHNVMDVPLSMFSIVGILGMTGIIINDSIVLVTQIDRYAEDRGLIPSIIDGAADRMRAVFLTTATTVLGLLPLLFEQSNDAQFLKPTVITLVFGLGFGMFLVLLVIPAVMAIQSDYAGLMGTVRRSLRFREQTVRRVSGWTGAAILAWLGTTMGFVVLNGELRPWLQIGLVDGMDPIWGGFRLFLIGLAIILTGTGIVYAILFGWRKRGGDGDGLRFSTPRFGGGGGSVARADMRRSSEAALRPLGQNDAMIHTPQPPAPTDSNPTAPRPSAVPRQATATATAIGGLGVLGAWVHMGKSRTARLLRRDTDAANPALRRMPPMPDPAGTEAFDRPETGGLKTDGPKTTEPQTTGADIAPDGLNPDASPVDGRLLMRQTLVDVPTSADAVSAADLPSTDSSTPSDDRPHTGDAASVAGPHTGASTPDMTDHTREPAPHQPAAPGRLVATPRAAEPTPPPPPQRPRGGGFLGVLKGLFTGLRPAPRTSRQTITAGEIERLAGQPISAEDAQFTAAMQSGQAPRPPGMPPAMAPPQATLEKSPLGNAIGAVLSGEATDRSVIDTAPHAGHVPTDMDVPAFDAPIPPRDAGGMQAAPASSMAEAIMTAQSAGMQPAAPEIIPTSSMGAAAGQMPPMSLMPPIPGGVMPGFDASQQAHHVDHPPGHPLGHPGASGLIPSGFVPSGMREAGGPVDMPPNIPPGMPADMQLRMPPNSALAQPTGMPMPEVEPVPIPPAPADVIPAQMPPSPVDPVIPAQMEAPQVASPQNTSLVGDALQPPAAPAVSPPLEGALGEIDATDPQFDDAPLIVDAPPPPVAAPTPTPTPAPDAASAQAFVAVQSDLRARASGALRSARILPPEPIAPGSATNSAKPAGGADPSIIPPVPGPESAPQETAQQEMARQETAVPTPPQPQVQPAAATQPGAGSAHATDRLRSARILPPEPPTGAPDDPLGDPLEDVPAGAGSLSPGLLALALEMEQELSGETGVLPGQSAPLPASRTEAVRFSTNDTFSSFMGPSGASIQPKGRLAATARKDPT